MARSVRTFLAVTGLAAVLAAGTPPLAGAQVPLDETLDRNSAQRLDRMEKAIKEMRAIVFQGRESGAPVVVQPADTQSQLSQMADRVSALEQGLARLTGELEVNRHDLDQARQEAADLRASNSLLKAQIADLQKSVQGLTPAPPPPPLEPAGPAGPAPGADAASSLASAKAALTAGDFPSAETGFRDVIDRFGDGPAGAEARYNLAKILMARRAFAEAATADIGAIRGWPHTRWAPDAVLDLSRSLIALAKPADACETLGELDRRYPKPGLTIAKRAAELRLQAKCG